MSKELSPSRTAEQFVVRFPDGMRDRIAEAAKVAGRSMNSEIVARLQASFSQAPQQADLVQLVNAAIDQRIGHITAALTLPSLTAHGSGGPSRDASTSPAQPPQKRVAPPLKKH